MADPVKIVVNATSPEKIVVNQGPITIQGGSNYTLPAATNATLGGIIVGDNLTVTANGVLSGVNSYTLPAATNSTLGGIIVGNGLTVQANGSISVSTNYIKDDAANGTLTITGDAGSTTADLLSETTGSHFQSTVNNSGSYGFVNWYLKSSPSSQQWTWGGYGIDTSIQAATISYNYAPNFGSGISYGRSLKISGSDITLEQSILGGASLPAKVWTANSILTQGYADARYVTQTGANGNSILQNPGYGAEVITPTNNASFNPDVINMQTTGIYTSLNASIDGNIISYPFIGFSRNDGSITLLARYHNTTESGAWYNTGINILKNAVNLFTNVGYDMSSPNAVVYRSYADSRYLLSANFTYSNLTGTPNLATVATSGSYNDLSNLPTLFDGSYTSLTNIPATFAPSAHNHTVSQITDFPSLATVATSGLYSDLTGAPDLTGYLTTASASSTYATISSLSSYLTTATAASTYQPIGSYATTGENTFSGTQSLAGNFIDKPTLRSARDAKATPPISAGTLTLDLNTSNFFAVSLNAAITTLSITNTPTSVVASFVLEFTADGTARAVAWPASFKFPSGTTPTLTTTAGKKDVFVVYTSDDGTTFDIVIAGQNL